MGNNKIKVLIIDDSALIRNLLSEMLDSDNDIEVIGTAQDAYIARQKIKDLKPDVLTLDVDMPKMNGITFLSNLMRLRPMPVIMVSSLTEEGADITLQALELGAVDFVAKPIIDVSHTFNDYHDEIITKVKLAYKARKAIINTTINSSFLTSDNYNIRTGRRSFKTSDTILAIGASTGGTEAIRVILEMMPADSPATVITQHIPEFFSRAFAKRMNRISKMTVVEASDCQKILPGHAYVAPGNLHLLVERIGTQYICHLSDEPPVNRHKPSVDVLFNSVAKNAGSKAIGVILTGMGKDGAEGMKNMHLSGATTIAQNENTSVVWGMPGAAVKLGCIDHVIPLDKIPLAIINK